MKTGSLIRVRHAADKYNGHIGILTSILHVTGFRDTYSVYIPSLAYEIGLTKEQCEAINEGR